MYDLVLPVFPMIVGFLMGSGVMQAVKTIFSFLFHVKETVQEVYSNALMIRDAGILMVKETFDSSVMLIRNILDGILVPILNATKELILLIRPVLEVVVAIVKTLILIIQRATELVRLIVETVSTILTNIFSTIHSFAANTTETVKSWATWAYEGTGDTFFYTLLYIAAFYLTVQVVIMLTKRLVKKIK